MWAKIWQWLKQLWHRWFGGGTPQPVVLTPPQPSKRDNAEYESIFMGLLDEVNAGRTRGELKFFIAKNKVRDEELTIWLQGFARELQEESRTAELRERLKHLGRLDIGRVSREAGRIVREWEESRGNVSEGLEGLVQVIPEGQSNPPVTVPNPPENPQTASNLETPQDINPEAVTLYNRGRDLYNAGDIQGALSCFEQAIEIQPNFHNAYNGRGTALNEMGRYEEAIADYNKAIEIQPNYHDAYNNRGLALKDMGRYEEAIADFNKALEIQPNYHLAYNGRGYALKNMGRYEEAIADYDRALEIKIDFWQAYANRGWAIFNSRGYEAALDSWDEGLSHLDSEKELLGCATLHQCKGNAHYAHGKRQPLSPPFFRQAVYSYLNALNLLPDDLRFLETSLEIIQDLIIVYRALGEPESAAEWELKAITQLDRLLRANRSPAKKLLLSRKFNSFYQLKCDRLAQSRNSADYWLALAEAEKWKNLSLRWLREGWIDPPKQTENRPSLPFPNDATAVLYWHLSPCTLTLFLLIPHRDPVIFTHPVDPPGKTAADENISEWLKNWKQTYNNSRKKKKEDNSSPQWETDLPSHLQTLQQLLQIETILSTLKTSETPIKNIILIPHRDLHLLPLHALFPTSVDADFIFTYLPSLEIAQNLIAKKTTKPASFSFLAIENPKSKIDLTFAAMAGRFIAHLYKILPHSRLIKEQASKENIRQNLPQLANVLNFIGHGSYSPENPLESTLYCAEDEPLTWQELFAEETRIELPAYFLVCLAACETGLSGTSNFIDELVGFPSGFLSRNTTYILSTLWIVKEDSTGILMMEFFRYLQAGKTPPEALKQAQDWLKNITNSQLAQWYIDRSEEVKQDDITQWDNLRSQASTYRENPDFVPYENPYFWAGFVLTGLP
ncbi:CHAT domain-containing tetratricopeptide repeat protein [Spirulina sp. 06S082]|uniref:CHAT domain-containing protein n=1 Tax=Spirulina sp. 06S082 TaxID=3110248 RepID=UPI002B20F9A2|nr:CHAT domain-containing tetratricopeptide repeat protein [Spirulina sp. 06S082]MEA5467897.1 CHAT domain-containing tetratricopeptide repeat protein [Spirulina sp. 06S082]